MSVAITIVIALITACVIIALAYWHLLRRPLPRISSTCHVPGFGVRSRSFEIDGEYPMSTPRTSTTCSPPRASFTRRTVLGRWSCTAARPAVASRRSSGTLPSNSIDSFACSAYGAPPRKEVETYDEKALGIVSAYAEGVGAFLDSPGQRLPVELRLLGVQPEPWTPGDCVAWAEDDGSAPRRQLGGRGAPPCMR